LVHLPILFIIRHLELSSNHIIPWWEWERFRYDVKALLMDWYFSSLSKLVITMGFSSLVDPKEKLAPFFFGIWVWFLAQNIIPITQCFINFLVTWNHTGTLIIKDSHEETANLVISSKQTKKIEALNHEFVNKIWKVWSN